MRRTRACGKTVWQCFLSCGENSPRSRIFPKSLLIHRSKFSMTKYVYSFGNGTADGDGKMKDTLGGKGAGLAEMCRAKLPVPPGFTISTQVCNLYFQNKHAVDRE